MDTSDSADLGKVNGVRNGVATQGEDHASPRPLENLRIDDIMAKIRKMVIERRSVIPVFAAEMPSFDASIATWKPVTPRLPVRDRYEVSELLAFSDADFVDVAYQTILRRPPDENGFNHYLRQLRSGEANKIEILGTLRFSEEGTAAGVQVDGLARPYRLQLWRRKPFVGPLISWIHGILRVGAISEHTAILDANRAHYTQELGRLLNEISADLVQRIIAVKVQAAGKVPVAEFENLRLDHATTLTRLIETDSKVSALQSDQASAMTHLAALQENTVTHLQALEDLVRTKVGVGPAETHALDSLYAAFEDHFRGAQSLVRARVEPYVTFVRECAAGTVNAPVVDIGCGRGEWLELLRDNGLVGCGIDDNRVFLEVCRGRGLRVIEGEAVESLRAMPANSAGMITSMHLVEHLPFERLIALLDEAHRVLRPGGLILLETPNPENLSVAHLWFYSDPTHRHPLPPEALRFMVEARGFLGARIERLVENREWDAPPLLSENIPGSASMNRVLASLNAAPDYAIVAKRP